MVELIIDSLDSVDGSLKAAYVEKDGKFVLDPDKYAEVKAAGLKKKNKELLDKLTAGNASLKRLEKLAELEDDDLERLMELHAKGDGGGSGNGDPGKLAELERELKLLRKGAEKHGTEKATIEQQLADLNKSLRHYKLTVPLRDIAAKAGVFADDLDLVMLDTSKRFALGEDDSIVLLDDDGDPSDVTPKKFFESVYKEQRPKFYQASGAGGSGSSNGGSGGGGGKTITRAQFDQMSPAEKADVAGKASKGEVVLTD